MGFLIGNLKAEENPRKLKYNNRDFIFALEMSKMNVLEPQNFAS